MIVLFKGHSLTPKNRFQPEAMSLSLAERTSTASMTLSPSAPTLSVDDWVQIEDGPGAGIVWRVKTIDEQFDKKTRTVSLEHVINTLRDKLMFGEVKTKDISGNKDSASALQAVQYILDKQSDWVLGRFAYSGVSNPYSFNGDDLFSALETVSSSLEDCIWEYSFDSYPFTLNIRHMNDTVVSEMRMDRNIKTLKKTIDRSRMYTRHYPIGKNNLHISGNYVSKNERQYGVVCKTETNNGKDTDATLRAWAQERLNRHCEPSVTVTISGLDLAGATGEPLDSFVIGKQCRVPLPEFNTTIVERVTRLNYTDIINEPMTVTVTLANELQDVATILKESSSSGGSSGRNQAKKDEEDHAWFLDTEDHVGMVAEAVAGPGAKDNWSRVSEVIVDGQGIHQRVTKTENEVVTMWSSIELLEDKIVMEVANAKSDTYSKIEQTASSIRSEVNSSKSTLFSVIMQTATNIYTQVGNAKSDTYSKIEQTASSIRSEVNSSKSTIYSTIMQTATNIYSEVANAKSGLYSSIEQTQSSISLKVGKGEVVSCINQTAETIKISASKIQLDGTTIANLIKTTEIQVSALEVTNGCDLNDVDCGYIDCTGIGTNTGNVNCGGKVTTEELKVGSYNATWKSKNVRYCQLSTERAFMYGSTSGASGTITGRIAIDYTDTTIYYLGR